MSQENILLTKLLSQRDEDAFELLFRRFYPLALDFATAICKDRQLAEDMTMDIFVGLWKNAGHLLDIEDIDAYILTALKNNIVHELRRKFSSISIEKLSQQLADSPTPEETTIYDQLAPLVDDIVSNMPPRQQEVFRLRYDQGLTNREIADRLHMRKAMALIAKVSIYLVLLNLKQL